MESGITYPCEVYRAGQICLGCAPSPFCPFLFPYLLGAVERLFGLVEIEAGTEFCEGIGLAGGLSQRNGLFNLARCLCESPDFCVGSRHRVERRSGIGAGQAGRPLGQPDRFGPIAEFWVGMGG